MTRSALLVAALLMCALAFPACEAFEQITRETIPPPDQTSPAGTVRLFKQAADSSDTGRALEYLCTKSGARMSALERFEYGDELQRYVNRIHGRYLRIWDTKGARVEGDTVATVNAEFDWLFSWKFKTRRIAGLWYISDIEEETP